MIITLNLPDALATRLVALPDDERNRRLEGLLPDEQNDPVRREQTSFAETQNGEVARTARKREAAEAVARWRALQDEWARMPEDPNEMSAEELIVAINESRRMAGALPIS